MLLRLHAAAQDQSLKLQCCLAQAAKQETQSLATAGESQNTGLAARA